jgi:NAD(P)-dependent dehydrogenase (short-subunit alcohol dehydrogenase family)
VDLNRPGTIEAAAGACGDVQLVVNNAGIYRSFDLLTDAGEAGLREEFEVNVVGPLRMARSFAPVLKANGGGAFAQLNSVVSVKSFASAATYSASKAASYSLTQALRDILGKDGTLVVSVHPGPIATDMATEAGFQEMAEPASVVSEALVASLKAGEFHCFPDRMARQIWGAYEGYARGVVEADMSGG